MRTEATARRFDRRLADEGRPPSISLQRKLVETKSDNNRSKPDLTDFMNDMFFGTTNTVDSNKSYNLTGEERRKARDADNSLDEFDSSTRSVSSRRTQDWLEKAKLMVASSPGRGPESPARLLGSPRFGTTQGRLSTSAIEKRDPLSRSARRQRALGGYSGEILSKTAQHTRNRSEPKLDPPSDELLPASDLQKWISNNLQFPNSEPAISPEPTPPSPTSPHAHLPPRQSMLRRSRFHSDPTAPLPHLIPTPTTLPSNSKRHFKIQSPSNNAQTTILDNDNLLSPPKNLIESAHRRSISSGTCSVPVAEPFSSPRDLVESGHRRSASSSTSRSNRILPRSIDTDGIFEDGKTKDQDLNRFLEEQRVKIGKILSGEVAGKAKIVLSGPSNSTSSMVAAICYAWLLENTKRTADKKRGDGKGNGLEFVVPLMNIRRGKMWNQRQAAWLFHHVNLDANALLFSDEADLETLMMTKKLSILVVGEDILRTNGEVGSACTILTDNYCEDAYDLLQTPVLKKLMLAGILLDTQNLSTSPKLSMTRDAEAVQLLSVGSSPNYRNTLFDQLMQDQRDSDLFEVLRRIYGKSPDGSNLDSREPAHRRTPGKNSGNKVVTPSEKKPHNETNEAKATNNILPSPGK
ncbi:uncharacterized protein [Primulina eburnea]|uniref:uncharacterized protein n=1 Tax=Primulina eburnea TaxID=1245227 RepID=UPI003C6CA20D